ncbi:ZG9 protein, partial [Centropus unirufus]|nr:ZG9 protein [Centropus unirufus]
QPGGSSGRALGQCGLSQEPPPRALEKPLSGPDCRKSFNHSSALMVHQRSHSGEKPFSCPTCRKRFNWRSALIMHQRSHNGKEPFTCPTCRERFPRKEAL